MSADPLSLFPEPFAAADPPRKTRRTVIFALSGNPALPPGEIRPMYYGCCFLVEAQRYEYIDPRRQKDVSRLVNRLRDATEIVTFDGTDFGLCVLREHHGLAGPVPAKGRHTDLAVVLGAQGRGGSLNDAALLNLRTPRLDIGALEPDPENRRHARQACQSDVRLTYQLWKLHLAGVLRTP